MSNYVYEEINNVLVPIFKFYYMNESNNKIEISPREDGTYDISKLKINTNSRIDIEIGYTNLIIYFNWVNIYSFQDRWLIDSQLQLTALVGNSSKQITIDALHLMPTDTNYTDQVIFANSGDATELNIYLIGDIALDYGMEQYPIAIFN